MIVIGAGILFLTLKREKGVIYLKSGQSLIFGYGSLVEPSSMENTLGYPYTGETFIANISGWKRSWTISYPNDTFYYEENGTLIYPERTIYLNLQRDQRARTNGVLYIVNDAELKTFDKREFIYDRIRITDNIKGLKVKGGEAYTYVAQPEYFTTDVRTPHEGAIRQAYLDIVNQGITKLGEAFKANYEAFSAPIPEHLVD